MLLGPPQPACSPRLIQALTASGGLLALSTGLAGLSLFRAQPFHFVLYLLNRAGNDTKTNSWTAERGPAHTRLRPTPHMHMQLPADNLVPLEYLKWQVNGWEF